MEICAVSPTGVEAVLEVGLGTTVQTLKHRIAEVLDVEFGDCMDLCVDGVDVTCGDTDSASDIPGIGYGCRIAVSPNGDRYAKGLANNKLEFSSLPYWARHHKTCVLAALNGSGQGWFSSFPPDLVPPSMWHDRDVMLRAVAVDFQWFHRASHSLRHDKEVILAAMTMRYNPVSHLTYHTLPPALRQDPDIAWAALRHAPKRRDTHSPPHPGLQHIPDSLGTDPAFIKSLGLSSLQGVSPRLLADKAFMLEVPIPWDDKVKHVAGSLCGDLDFFHAALLHGVDVHRLLSRAPLQGVRSDAAVMQELAGAEGDVIGYAAPELFASHSFALNAMILTGGAAYLRHHAAMPDSREVALAAGSRCVSARWLSDKAFVCEALRKGFDVFSRAADTLQCDRDVVTAAVRLDPEQNYRHAPPALRRDRDVVLAALSNGAFLCDLDDSLRSDRGVVLEAVRLSPKNILFACEGLRDDKDVALAVVRHTHAEYFRWLGDEVRCDAEVADAAVRQDQGNILFCPNEAAGKPSTHKATLLQVLPAHPVWFHRASPTLRRSKDVALAALQGDKRLYHGLCDALRDDPDVAVAALGYRVPLHHMSVAVRADARVVGAAMTWDMRSFRHASDELRADKAVAQRVLRHHPYLLQHVPPEVRADPRLKPEMVWRFAYLDPEYDLQCFAQPKHVTYATCLSETRKGVRAGSEPRPQMPLQQGCQLSDLDPSQCSKDAMLVKVRASGRAIIHAPPALRRDRDVALAALANGASLWDVYGSLCSDRGVVLEAVRLSPKHILFACEGLRDDKEVALAVVRHTHAEYFRWLGDEVRDDLDVADAAVLRSGWNFTFCGPSMRGNETVLRHALADRAHSTVLFCASPALQGHDDIARLAVRQNSENLRALPHPPLCLD